MNEKPERRKSDPDLSEICDKVIENLGRAHDLPREPMQEEMRHAGLALFDLRDRLIDVVRRDGRLESSPWRQSLNLVNQAASLVAGVEYPSGGIKRDYIREAWQIMEGVRKNLT